jgi:hypothetical protein
VSSSTTRIFLSHSDKNRAAATKIHAYLTEHGYDVWYSRRRIHAGSWLKEIGEALDRCSVFLLLLSPQAVKSKWVQRELDYALTHKQYDKRIVIAELVRANIEDLTWALCGQQITKLHSPMEKHFSQLLRAVRRVAG